MSGIFPPHLSFLSSLSPSLSLALLLSTASSLEKASPLPEGRSRSLRSNRSYSGSSVAVVKMTPLSFIPGAKIIKYLGIINMFFIRETSSLREEGGVSGFLHTFIAEVFAMVRAHVAALGGNAVVSYSMKECVFMENPNKNQVNTCTVTHTHTQTHTHSTHHVCSFMLCAFTGAVPNQRQWGRCYFRPRI
ncbi:hypothetical protein cypCar_00037368 [Cyprinus carpio]|nr:hypothetical protein cypCar_00037368 [Cyprinus carpio]